MKKKCAKSRSLARFELQDSGNSYGLWIWPQSHYFTRTMCITFTIWQSLSNMSASMVLHFVEYYRWYCHFVTGHPSTLVDRRSVLQSDHIEFQTQNLFLRHHGVDQRREKGALSSCRNRDLEPTWFVSSSKTHRSWLGCTQTNAKNEQRLYGIIAQGQEGTRRRL